MITLYSYPELFGLPDNNPYGLKIFAFLRLVKLPFTHEHILDASQAPRGQLPYITDGAETVGDSDTIIAHLTKAYGLTIDDGLTMAHRDTRHLVGRMLDNLYWVMSYSRWKDPAVWPAFKSALLKSGPGVTAAALEAAQAFNFQRYHFQGIGRFEPKDAYARGLADLEVLARLLPESGFVFGERPCSLDASIYGFTANIYFHDIDTPLKRLIVSRPPIVAHCNAVRAAL